MAPIRADAERALHTFVTDNQARPGHCTIRLAEFDEYAEVYPSTPICDVDRYRLRPRGMTALLDGIGRLVVDFDAELGRLPAAQRPENVVVIVQTDGAENCSKEWNRSRVSDLIHRQRAVCGWDFVFLAADQDAITVGADLGVEPSAALTWSACAERDEAGSQ